MGVWNTEKRQGRIADELLDEPILNRDDMGDLPEDPELIASSLSPHALFTES